MRFSGVILAGGENRRYQGVVKARLVVNGRPIIENTLELFERIFDDILIVTNTPEQFSPYKRYRMVPDIYTGIGPLGGLHSALFNLDTDAIFMVASDMPWLSEELIIRMKSYFSESGSEALIPRHNGLDEPLHAVYSAGIKERLGKFLETTSSYAIREFLKLADVEYMNLDNVTASRNPFANINRPGDLEQIRQVEDSE